MKKTYTTPEVEVSAVSAQDILNTSAEIAVTMGDGAILGVGGLY